MRYSQFFAPSATRQMLWSRHLYPLLGFRIAKSRSKLTMFISSMSPLARPAKEFSIQCSLTWSGLQLSLTYFPAELSSSHTKCAPLKNFIFVCRISVSGMGPRVLSIIAKCSRASCAGNSWNPLYISNIRHPTDHTSQGCDQPSSEKVNKKLTSVTYTVGSLKIWPGN